MLDINLDVRRLGELEEDFTRLSAAMANTAIRAAVMAGANVARDKTRKSAPVRSGKLKKQIVVTRVPQQITPGAAVAGLRVRRPGRKKGSTPQPESSPYYWFFLEWGTSKMAAKPFVRPAWDNHLTQIENAVRSKLAQAIDHALGQG